MPRTCRSSLAVALAKVGAAIVAVIVMSSCDVPTTPVPSQSLDTPSATESRSAPPSPTARASAVPDQSHGFLTLEPSALRSEASSATLATLPVAYLAAASPNGRRVAIVERTQKGGQLLTFDTSVPSQRTFVLEFSGTVVDNRASGEFPSSAVWAGDDTDSLLVTVDVYSAPSVYTSQRVVDLQTKQVRELARIGFVPLAWHPASDTAVGWAFRGDGGFADSYVLVRGGRVTRSQFPLGEVIGSTVRASPDGRRIIAVYGGTSAQSGGTIRWWSFDRFDQQTELPSVRGEWIINASWRPGVDELVVSVATGTYTPTVPRLEVWPLQGARRVLRSSGGLLLVRSDGTAALAVDYALVDLATGATSTVPRLSPTERPYLAVRL